MMGLPVRLLNSQLWSKTKKNILWYGAKRMFWHSNAWRTSSQLRYQWTSGIQRHMQTSSFSGNGGAVVGRCFRLHEYKRHPRFAFGWHTDVCQHAFCMYTFFNIGLTVCMFAGLAIVCAMFASDPISNRFQITHVTHSVRNRCLRYGDLTTMNSGKVRS